MDNTDNQRESLEMIYKSAQLWHIPSIRENCTYYNSNLHQQL